MRESVIIELCFFCFKQKTAYEMRISDWSSRRVLFRSADLAALALPVGGRVVLADGTIWRLARRRVKGAGIEIELCRYQPLDAAAVAADPGTPVTAPDWPDAEGAVRLVDLP